MCPAVCSTIQHYARVSKESPDQRWPSGLGRARLTIGWLRMSIDVLRLGGLRKPVGHLCADQFSLGEGP
jgi:hypothetical protein